MIKRIDQRRNPRACLVSALPAPNRYESTERKLHRYVEHLPVAGELIPFGRSCCEQAGVERVIGFCMVEYLEFSDRFRSSGECSSGSGVEILRFGRYKSDEEQRFRVGFRTYDPLKQW